jgi:hypothetical protein
MRASQVSRLRAASVTAAQPQPPTAIDWRRLGLIVGILLLGILLVVLVTAFLIDLIQSKESDAAAALGGVLGGALGACGAGFAVYLTLQVQRHEDARRADAAIRREVEELGHFAVAQLRRCKQIRGSKQPISYEQLGLTMMPHEPVVFSLIADRIGLVENQVALMSFYRQLRETSALITLF